MACVVTALRIVMPCRSPPPDEQVFEQSRREFASTKATARTTDAAVQVAAAGAAVSLGARYDLRLLSAASTSDDRRRLSPCSREGLSDLATGDVRPIGDLEPSARLPSGQALPCAIKLAMP